MKEIAIKYNQLTEFERYQIFSLLKNGLHPHHEIFLVINKLKPFGCNLKMNPPFVKRHYSFRTYKNRMKKRIYNLLKKYFIKKQYGHFDSEFYITWYPDVNRLSNEQATEHWRRYGQKQRRHPNFDSLLASQKMTIEKLPKDFDW